MLAACRALGSIYKYANVLVSLALLRVDGSVQYPKVYPKPTHRRVSRAPSVSKQPFIALNWIADSDSKYLSAVVYQRDGTESSLKSHCHLLWS